jgi:magnesium-transporting ATPase (P-type)
VICTDKTGTLTLGQMTARRVVTPDAFYTISGEGYAAEGAFLVDGTTVPPGPGLLNVLRAVGRPAVESSHASLQAAARKLSLPASAPAAAGA